MYIGWTIIHAVFLILWLVLLFLGARLVRKQYGTSLYVLMIAGLLGMMISVGQSQFKRGFSQNSQMSGQVFLEDFSAFSLIMRTYFDRDTSNTIFRVHEDVTMNGLISGFVWETDRIDLKRQENNGKKFDYLVLGNLKWKLLGLTVYTEPKRYRGVLTVHPG